MVAVATLHTVGDSNSMLALSKLSHAILKLANKGAKARNPRRVDALGQVPAKAAKRPTIAYAPTTIAQLVQRQKE